MKCACCDLTLVELTEYQPETNSGRMVLRSKKDVVPSSIPLHTYMCPACGSIKFYVGHNYIKELMPK